MSITIECIEFTKDEVPVSKKVDINGVLYTLEIQYNETGDFYTSILYDDADNPVISSKLVYMGNAFNAMAEGIPAKKLFPLNVTDLDSERPADIKVNAETFGNTVKLYLV